MIMTEKDQEHVYVGTVGVEVPSGCQHNGRSGCRE